ncbi:IS21 family transposase, partial [Bifidobacterium thermophilum]
MSHARIARGLHVVPHDGGGVTPRGRISPRVRRAGRTLIDSGYAEIVEGWSAADPGFPRKQRHTVMRVWQRLREPRVRGLVSVGAALGQAVAGAASRGVGGGTRGSRGRPVAAQAGFRPGARVDRGRGACGAFPGGLVSVSGHAV